MSVESRARDIADLQRLVAATLAVWDGRRPDRRPSSRDALVVSLLTELPFDRPRLESLLVRYGPALLEVFRAARATSVMFEGHVSW